DLHGLPRPCLPARRDHGDALPHLPSVRGACRRQGPDPCRPQGDALARHAGVVRPRAACPFPHPLLPVHGAFDRARRLVRDLRRQGLPHVQVVGLDRDGRRRHGRSARVRERRPRPGGVDRLRVRLRAGAGRAAPPRHPGNSSALGRRPTSLEAVLMRVPVSWLRDYVPLEMPLDDLATRLSISSAEVEGIERRGVPDSDGNLGRFLVGRVVEAGKHPNPDRLQLCRVDVGDEEPLQIVCGAWNFGPGATVAVALPGAVLPGGLELERGKVRGELSNGMILAEDEVDLGPDHTGIMVLDDSWEPGTPLADVLPIVDDVLHVEATGNRPDLLSIYGLAREVVAIYDLEL